MIGRGYNLVCKICDRSLDVLPDKFCPNVNCEKPLFPINDKENNVFFRLCKICGYKEDVFDFDDAKLAEFYIKSLPSDLGEASDEFEQSKLMKETFGEHAFDKFLGLKRAELSEFKQSVTDWEREHYMDL